MSEEDKSSKTEEPSERKLEKAREQGQVPKSREVNNFFMLMGMALALSFTIPPMMGDLRDILGTILQEAGLQADGGVGSGGLAEIMVYKMVLATLPTMFILLLFSVAGGFIQTGPLIAYEAIQPKLARISIMKGLGRMFGLKSVVELLKSIAKMAIIGGVMWMVMASYKVQMAQSTDYDIVGSVLLVQEILLKSILGVLAIAALLAIMDYLYQRFDFMQEQRMTKQELKDEYKETQGDPFVKNRQRQIRMERARQRMMQEVPKSQVVVTNPTHFAVALSYDRDKDAAPRVVAKGADHIAQKIRELATENGVPLLEDPPLARALYEMVDVDSEVPLDLYEAVAQVISYVFAMGQGRKTSYQSKGLSSAVKEKLGDKLPAAQ
ncbi:MAG: flagellar biosynthesis protein FlhB [Proteobacteria bacterium]|nr:flagellar biosynthesis protein FlhB [Pseudomonadota bacterium]